MRLAYFTHSLRSCWNHGNAHFQRGVLRQLMALGCEVTIYEEANGWSLTNLLQDHGRAGIEPFEEAYPELHAQPYDQSTDLEAVVGAHDVVILHEWSPDWLVEAMAKLRRQARFTLLYHDTHHRLISAPQTMPLVALEEFDGILAFGSTLADYYAQRGWGGRVFVWHEAADISLFKPPQHEYSRRGLVWIGNWGDGERSEEIASHLLTPAAQSHLPLHLYGVRYPPEQIEALARADVHYHGWCANVRAPQIYAHHLATFHIPRRWYTQLLPGIPTIRVFEALACGIPLLCAPWEDSDHLFRPGLDYLIASSPQQMVRALRDLQHDPQLRQSLVAHGLETIRARHSCWHRAHELLQILHSLSTTAPLEEFS